jgi:hypothetical protein
LTPKGSLICTAALELSTNQVTHFYSKRKNTAEMIKNAVDASRKVPRSRSDLFIVGRRLMARVESIHQEGRRDQRATHQSGFTRTAS